MLYDILPPLLLFISFGGIIVVISRVVLRIRRVQFSEDIQAEVDSEKPIHEASLLRPEEAGVTLVKNRLVYIVSSITGGVLRTAASIGTAMRSFRQRHQEARAEKVAEKDIDPASPAGRPAVQTSTIQMPEVGLKDRISVLAQKGKEGLASLQKEIANRMPAYRSGRPDMKKIRENIPKKEESIPAPKSVSPIRLVRHSGNETATEQKAESAPKQGIVSQILNRKTEASPLELAAQAIENNDFEAAEDVLVPHIIKHSSDTKAYMLLGKIAIGKESWEEAMEIFQQVIKIDKTLSEAYADLGHAALNAGKFTLAIQSLQSARNMDADNIRIREELLFIARRMDNKVVEKGVLEELQELKEKA